MDLDTLRHAVTEASALRRRQRLQPAGGPGDKIFPPTYPVDSAVTHVFERRRIGGDERVCVLVDSVQSQANRLEEALLAAAEAGRLRLPRLVVDFPSAGLPAVGTITDLQAPHRVFDAILRDSALDGLPFRKSEIGQRLQLASLADASAILEIAPASLVFGVWNSTGAGGGLGAKFARALVSEIIAVDVPAEEIGDRHPGEQRLRSAGRRTGSRIDPLGVPSSIEIYVKDGDWALDEAALGKGAKKHSPSEINHGNIKPSVKALGITCDYVLQTQVLSFAALRRLRFGGDIQREVSARCWIAALGIVAMVEGNRQGMVLRSRCDLVCEGGMAPLELIGYNGQARIVEITPDGATALAEAAFEAARAAGFELDPAPRRMTPTQKLIDLVREAQKRTLAGEADPGVDQG